MATAPESSSADAASIGDPNQIEPLKDPALARQALVERPASTLDVGEEPFVLPLLPLLDAAKQDVPPEIEVLRGQKDFYLLKFGINATVKGKERFRGLDIKFDYPNDSGFLTYALAPDTEIEKRFSANASVTIGLDAIDRRADEQLDPVGFAMEDFDAIGRHRLEEQGQPIDAEGGIPSLGHPTGSIEGGAELALLVADSEVTQSCFSRQWLQYALGREHAAMEQYRELAQSTQPGPIRQLFEFLADEETQHKAELEKLYYELVHHGGV